MQLDQIPSGITRHFDLAKELVKLGHKLQSLHLLLIIKKD